MSVFVLTCTMMSSVAEAMLRAKEYAEITTASLRDSEARFRALFNNTVIGMAVIDEQGRIEEFNPACETIFAYSKEEVIGQNVNLLMAEPYQSEHDGYLKNYLAGGERKVIGIERQLQGRRKGNATFPLELLVDEVNLDSRRIFVGFIKDITERKLMEDELKVREAKFRSIIEVSPYRWLCMMSS